MVCLKSKDQTTFAEVKEQITYILLSCNCKALVYILFPSLVGKNPLVTLLNELTW